MRSFPPVLAGRYELLDRAGQGGMSVVWRAWDRETERAVAVKVPAGEHAADPAAVRRWRHEAEMTAAVAHPGVVRLRDYVEHDGTVPALVLDYLGAGDLQQRLATGRPGAVGAMRTGAQIAAALAAVHDSGIVHCDVSAANVVPVDDGVKIIDFGIATPAGSTMWQANPFEVLGTPAYLAPERLSVDAAHPAADVYAFGVLLYRLLSGRSPWAAETGTQMVAAHLMREPAPLPRSPLVPPEIAALCGRCLAKDPVLRPTAAEAEWLLRRAIGGDNGQVPVPQATHRRPAPPSTCPIRRPWSSRPIAPAVVPSGAP